LKIRVTDRAQKRYTAIVKQIRGEWGISVADAFERRTKNFFAILSDFPELGVLEEPQKQLRAFQLSKITRVYYQIRKTEIVVIYFFDVRQSPAKRPK